MSAEQEKEASKIHHIGEQEPFQSGQPKIFDKLTRREFMARMVYIYAAIALAVVFYFTATRNPPTLK